MEHRQHADPGPGHRQHNHAALDLGLQQFPKLGQHQRQNPGPGSNIEPKLQREPALHVVLSSNGEGKRQREQEPPPEPEQHPGTKHQQTADSDTEPEV